MRLTLVGFTVPEELMLEINRNGTVLASQTYRFSWSVVAALKAAEIDVDLLSVAPVVDYPEHPRLVWGPARFAQRGVNGKLLPFLNALLLKHLTRALSMGTMGLHHIIKRDPDWILVHGVHTPFLWFGLAAAKVVRGSVAAILTDPPGVVRDNDSYIRRSLKRLDVHLTKCALMRMDAVVVLAQPLARDFAPGVPFLVMEGIREPATRVESGQSVEGEEMRRSFRVTYAGGLSEAYGIKDLVEAVMSSTCQDLTLRLYGRGPLEGWIRDRAEEDSRIQPSVLLEPADVSRVYQESDVLVQPRSPAQGFVPYSFPSKLIEYMASGVPVITTRLPSIPEDYDGHVIWSGDGPAGLRESIEDLRGWSERRRTQFGLDAKGFIERTRSAAPQGKRILDFLRHNARVHGQTRVEGLVRVLVVRLRTEGSTHRRHEKRCGPLLGHQ